MAAISHVENQVSVESFTIQQADQTPAEIFCLATDAPTPILAVGGELKSSICLYSGSTARMSPPLGNLTDPRNYRIYRDNVAHLIEQAGVQPKIVAHDLHPGYLSTRFARESGLPTVAVQHHHAHIVSVMAEHHIDQPVIGICCDGVGYGTDHAAWGCEVLQCTAGEFIRVAHLEYFPLLGADAAAIETWRPALVLARQAFGTQWKSATAGIFDRVPTEELDAMVRLGDSKLPCVMTSSLGRVFDAVSFMLSLCDKNQNEAQAAIALEHAACDERVEPYPYETTKGGDGINISLSAAIRAIVTDVSRGRPVAKIASRFHETVARMLAVTAMAAAENASIQTVVLSGGCFANQRLTTRVIQCLRQLRYRALCNNRISCGDGGLALGQAVAAAAMHERNRSCA